MTISVLHPIPWSASKGENLSYVAGEATRIVERLGTIIHRNRTWNNNLGYTGILLGQLVNDVSQIAETAFDFDMDNVAAKSGFCDIVAVGVLVRLRLSFTPILRFQELPRFGLRGSPMRKVFKWGAREI
jgi:hypothetical protein